MLSNFSSGFANCVDGKGYWSLTMTLRWYGGSLPAYLFSYLFLLFKGSPDKSTELSELYGGARISYIFTEVFGKRFSKLFFFKNSFTILQIIVYHHRMRTLDPFEGLDDEDIRISIANANGPRPSLFVSEISFDLLVNLLYLLLNISYFKKKMHFNFLLR